jgi:hypothetical protein
MSPEFRDAGEDESRHIECVDNAGNEIFPAAGFRQVGIVPAMLDAELENAGALYDQIPAALRVMATNIRIHHDAAVDLLPKEGRRGMQQAIKEDALESLTRKHIPRAFTTIRAAIPDVAPNEFSFYMSMASENMKPTDEDLLRSGTLDHPSRFAKMTGKAARLHENSFENVETLVNLSEAADYMFLLETHTAASKLLDLCLGFGSNAQINTARTHLNRLKNIACSETLDAHEKVCQQLVTVQGVRQLVESINFDADEEAREHIGRLTVDCSRIALDNYEFSLTLSMMIYGRLYQLNGNHHPTQEELEPLESISSEETIQIRGSGQVAEAELPPNKLDEYRGALESILEQANGLLQPELLTAKEIKRRGLDDARAVLVRGESDKEGNTIINGRSKSEAQQDTSTIEFLRSFIMGANSLLEAKEALEQAEEACSDYLSTVEAFVSDASSELSVEELTQIKASVPTIGSLKELLDAISEDWSSTEYLLQNYWPDGPAAAKELHSLLFMTSDELAAEITQNAEAGEDEPADTEPLELPVDQVIDINPLKAHNELASIARQLDEIILPPRATQSDVKRIIEESGLTTEQAAEIDWARLYNLVTLREQNDGTMYRSKEGSLGNAPPYFVVTIDFQGDTYAVAESPVEGNATYVISEKECPGTWLEVLQLDKASARDIGARRVIHRQGRTAPDHLSKIQDVLIDLAIAQAA